MESARPRATGLQNNLYAFLPNFCDMTLIIDPQVAGIAGDMLLCSLVDMGADGSRIARGVTKAVSIMDGSAIGNIEFAGVTRCGMRATGLLLDIQEEAEPRTGAQLRSWIVQASEELGLSPAASSFALASVGALISAEARIHGQDPDSVHLHETAGADTVVDILGTAMALEDLHLYGGDVFCCPVAVGGGTVSFSHGTTSNPTAAVLEILKGTGIAIAGGQARAEMTTPTGASMLAGLRPAYLEHYPTVQVDRVGYGAGTMEFDGFANVLKVVAGRRATETIQDTVHILETNVDDVSGELLGVTVERLMEAGARDVTVVPGLTKKGRPTNVITVICDHASADLLLGLLMEETGTLGVRVRTSRRVLSARQAGTADISIDGQGFTVRYQAHGSSGRFKAESDDIRRVSSATGRSFGTTEELIRAQIRKILDEHAG